jgi:hypothetical protein
MHELTHASVVHESAVHELPVHESAGHEWVLDADDDELDDDEELDDEDEDEEDEDKREYRFQSSKRTIDRGLHTLDGSVFETSHVFSSQCTKSGRCPVAHTAHSVTTEWFSNVHIVHTQLFTSFIFCGAFLPRENDVSESCSHLSYKNFFLITFFCCDGEKARYCLSGHNCSILNFPLISKHGRSWHLDNNRR